MGRRQVGYFVSAEGGQLVTAVICVSVTGSLIPPLFILLRVWMKDELMNGVPPGSLYECHKTDWMHMDIFLQGRIFIKKIQQKTIYIYI